MRNRLLSVLKNNRYQLILAATFGLFPIVCAITYCILDGHWITDLYIPASYWNDELMYYKQVEAVVNCGLPQGWFGYQETHGSIYPFAVWSPAVIIPWIIWGQMFGWGLYSPIFANIGLNVIAMVAFAILVKPSWKQSIVMLGLFAVFTPYSRYLLSCMPETVYLSMGIWLAALVISYTRVSENWKLIAMFSIAVLITLGRPYLGLLMLLPMWFVIKRKKWVGGVISVIIATLTAIGYVLITKFCCATYVVPSLDTGWIQKIFTEGLLEGLQSLYSMLREKIRLIITYHFVDGVKYGLISGALYMVTLIIIFFLTLRSVIAFRKRKDFEYRVFWVIQVLMTVGMVVAILLFYRVGEGAKHLMIFIILGMIWLSLMEEKAYLLKIVTAVFCLYFFVIKAFAPFDWQAPYDDGRIKTEMEALESQLAENMVLADTKDRFDDTVIWLNGDMVDGRGAVTPFGYLYMIPEGFGINFCLPEYVMDNVDQLKSAYIALVPGGDVEKAVLERGAVLMGGVEELRVYKLR